MVNQTYLAAGGVGIGALALAAVSRQGENFDVDGLRAAYQAELAAMQERLEEAEQAQEGNDGPGADYIRQVNQALQQTLSTAADTDASEAFEEDLQSGGGLISGDADEATGGGNPDYGLDDDSGSSSSSIYGDGSYQGDYDWDSGSSWSADTDDGSVLDEGDVSSIGLNP